MSLRQPAVIDLDGVAMALVAAQAGGDTFPPGDHTFVIIKNAHAANARTITPDSVRQSDFGTDVDVPIVVPALTTVLAGPFPASRFRNAADGQVHLSYSDAAADLSILPVRL